MMSADKLNQLRSKVKRGEMLDRDQQLAVLDHGLQSLVEIQGGQSTLDRRRELADREREVGNALADLRQELNSILDNIPADLEPAVVDGAPLIRDVQKALYVADAAAEMFRAKGPAWKREWSWYRPRVEEEFGQD